MDILYMVYIMDILHMVYIIMVYIFIWCTLCVYQFILSVIWTPDIVFVYSSRNPLNSFNTQISVCRVGSKGWIGHSL